MFPAIVVETPGTRLRRMAKDIDSPETFARVIADVEGPPELHAAVRDLLLPLLPPHVRDAILTTETDAEPARD